MDETQKRLLTDSAWQALDKEFAMVKPRRGRPSLCERQFLDAIRWMLRTDAPWRDLPASLGRWQSVYRRFSRWAQCGRWQVFRQHLAASQDGVWADQHRLCIDSTSVRVHAHGSPPKEKNAEQQVGQSRGGRTTKLHLARSGSAAQKWTARRAVLSPGNVHDVTAIPALFESRLPGVYSVVADKAHEAAWLGASLEENGIWAIIPSRGHRCPWHRKDAREYRHRSLVERALGRLKPFRRASSRFDRLARNFGAFVQIAFSLSLVGASALPR